MLCFVEICIKNMEMIHEHIFIAIVYEASVWRTDLEACGTPVNELNSPLSLDGSDGGVHVLGHHIASEQKTACHVLPVTGVAFHHLRGKGQVRAKEGKED